MNWKYILIILITIVLILRKLIHPIKRLIVFHPNKIINKFPTKYTEFNLQTNDKQLINGWIVHPSTESNGLYILFSHGNAGNISDRIDFSDVMCSLGYTFILYDYRGYGKSTGYPSEKGVYLDSEAVWKYMIDVLKIKPKNIIIYGNSLGTSVSAYLASKLDGQYKCLILQAPFYSLKYIAADILPKSLSVLSVFVNEFKTHQYLEKIKRPILFIHSKTDGIISCKHSDKLYDEVKKNGKCYADIHYINGGHNNPILDQNYKQKIITFINQKSI